MRLRTTGLLAPLALFAAACGSESGTTEPDLARTAAAPEVINPYLAEANQKLAAQGVNYRVDRAEYVVSGTGEEAAGRTVFADNRTLRLTSRWVPGDERRVNPGPGLTYAHFQGFMESASGFDATPAIDASFDTWEALSCSTLELTKEILPGNVFPSGILSLGPSFLNNPQLVDINTVGFLPGAIFDLVLGAGASDNVLGVTFTFVWGTNTPDGFVPSDVDGNGRDDTAFKEVWYNDDFAWTLNGSVNPYDVETVALHENGHALEIGHFGSIFRTEANGKLHVSPRAVMNAAIVGRLRTPLGTDQASYCGNFAAWPNN